MRTWEELKSYLLAQGLVEATMGLEEVPENVVTLTEDGAQVVFLVLIMLTAGSGIGPELCGMTATAIANHPKYNNAITQLLEDAPE